jgi:regulator of protease activity HflC (stomatin/prohibitin superfamily)
MEKTIKPVSGFLTLLVTLILFIVSIFLFTQIDKGESKWYPIMAILSLLTSIFLALGLIIISPNHSRVLTFFGKYVETAKENGLLFVNPLYKKQKISMRSENLESAKLKVNDKMGNPIEIPAYLFFN